MCVQQAFGLDGRPTSIPEDAQEWEERTGRATPRKVGQDTDNERSQLCRARKTGAGMGARSVGRVRFSRDLCGSCGAKDSDGLG